MCEGKCLCQSNIQGGSGSQLAFPVPLHDLIYRKASETKTVLPQIDWTLVTLSPERIQSLSKAARTLLTSVMVPERTPYRRDRFFGVADVVGNADSVQATPNAVGRKLVRVRFSTGKRIIILKNISASRAYAARYGIEEQRFAEGKQKDQWKPEFPRASQDTSGARDVIIMF